MRRRDRARSIATLARWLGPWADQERAPDGVTRRATRLGGVDSYVYYARNTRGAYVVSPGLHYEGPDDPRFDRFARVLATAGLRVYAPKLTDYLALRVAQRASTELAAALESACDEVERDGLPPPALFSVSFGSLPALAAAASGQGERIGGVVLFGGYCDFAAAIEFALTGAGAGRPFDPLNGPVVHMHLADADATDHDARRVIEAWRAMVHQTWGRAELKQGLARAPIAHAIGRDLPPRERAIFLDGCGLAGGPARHLPRVRDLMPRFPFADPRPHLARLRAPIVIVHGRDDDVIPFEEAHKLASALPAGHPHRVILTGLYGHTGSSLPRPSAAAREGRALVGLLRTLAIAPEGREAFVRLCR